MFNSVTDSDKSAYLKANDSVLLCWAVSFGFSGMHGGLRQLKDGKHLLSDAECSDDDVSGDVCRLEPYVNVVVARVLSMPVALTLLLHSEHAYTHIQLSVSLCLSKKTNVLFLSSTSSV